MRQALNGHESTFSLAGARTWDVLLYTEGIDIATLEAMVVFVVADCVASTMVPAWEDVRYRLAVARQSGGP